MSEDLAKIEDALFEVCDEYLKDEKYKQFDARRDNRKIIQQHLPAPASGEVTSVTWGDLPKQVAERILPYEWDNKTPCGQRDWCIETIDLIANCPDEAPPTPDDDGETEAQMQQFYAEDLRGEIAGLKREIAELKSQPTHAALPSDEEVGTWMRRNYHSSTNNAVWAVIEWLRSRQPSPAATVDGTVALMDLAEAISDARDNPAPAETVDEDLPELARMVVGMRSGESISEAKQDWARAAISRAESAGQKPAEQGGVS